MAQSSIPDVPDVPTRVVSGRGEARGVWEHVAALEAERLQRVEPGDLINVYGRAF
ncbi:MAG: hypothetical protein PVH68_16645 [Armatimonadota bacterium]|jgi:hypothetical protein